MNWRTETKIPVLIPVFNNLEYTKKAVASLLHTTNLSLFECLIIDNGSTDDTPKYLAELVAARPENFRVIRSEKNLGFGGGLNLGLDLIGSFKWDYAVIANNDLVFTPNWLENLLSMMNSVPYAEKIGIIGPMSNFAGGSQGVDATDKYASAEELDRYATDFHLARAGRWREVGVVVGLLMVMRRKFFDEVGKFDERFFPGTWEENDLELRGALKGWKYAVDESTFIHHYGSKTLRTTEESKDERKNFITNRDRFRKKWRSAESPWEELARERYALRGQNPEDFKGLDGRYRKWVVAACRVKDGAPFLARTLDRVSDFADEIVILVDQHTKDDTFEICQRYSKVVSLAKEPPHEYNEAWSRNRVLQMAYDRHPDFVFCFDSDEVIEQRAVDHRDELTDPEDPAVMLWIQPIVQLWNRENLQRMDGVWGTFYQGRMFRVLPGQNIDNANNLLHSGSTPHFPSDRHGFSFFRIAHYGNVDASLREKKYEWYTKTDKNKDLNMVLGGHKDYYWKLYYGAQNAEDPKNVEWKVLPDDEQWKRPPYGCFYERDVYRHVKDELGMVLQPFVEENTISLCMLVKNESGLLARAISSARSYVNEIIVIDTGSVDGSDVVAEQLGAKVYRFDWKHDFSKARNFSISKATGKWILRIDPDEVIPRETALELAQLVQSKTAEGYVFPICNWLATPGTPGATWALSETCRLFKNQYPTIYYTNPVHEELDDSFRALATVRIKTLIQDGVPDDKAKEMGRLQVIKVPFQINHFGYLRGKSFLDKKFDYYYQLGKKHIEVDPKDSRPWFNTAVHLLHCKKYEEALKHYQKVLELDSKNFMAWNDCGTLYAMVLNDFKEAERCFETSLSVMNEHTHPAHREKTERNLEELKLKLLTRLHNIG